MKPINVGRYFTKHAAGIINRLAELRVAENLAQIPSGPPPCRHKLTNQSNQWAVRISKNYRLIFEPRGEYDPNNTTTITEICIIKIEDYH